MFSAKSNKVKDMPNIYFNGQKITIVKETKYLGVYLDQMLSFKKTCLTPLNIIFPFKMPRIEATFMFILMP